MFQWSDTRGGSQRTVVMGCGKLGAVVAASLADNGHSVHVLDTRTEAFERLPLDKTESGQIVPIVADGTVQQDLVNSSVPDADVFMALSSVETRNALAAQLAKNVFHVPKVVCLIRRPRPPGNVQQPGPGGDERHGASGANRR